METQILAVTPAVSAQAVAVTPVPVGTIIMYGGNDIPNGWFRCEGQSITQARNPNLFAVIGGTVPDLRSRFIVGAGSAYKLNEKGGADTVTLNEGQIPAHKHYGLGEAYSNWPYGKYSPSEKADNMGSKGDTDNDNWFYGTTSTGGNQAHENRPPYYAL